MQKTEEVVNGAYAYNLIADLIDYRGDIKKNNQNKEQPKVYSPDFSPNNIRRLILSGDGAMIYFHVPISGKYYKTKRFSQVIQMNINNCLYLPDYKPMIWALAGGASTRVCASIEEVIICTQNNGGIELSRELKFEGLIADKDKKSGDIKFDISDRYKRLAYFTIVSCDINTLVCNNEVKMCNSPTSLISETNFVKNNAISITKFKDDWYNYYKPTSTYSFDSADSPLNKHFKQVKSSMAENARKDGIAKIKQERLKGVSEEFEKEFKKYKGVYECVNRLSFILKFEGTTYMTAGTSPLFLSSFKEPDAMKSGFSKLSDKDKCNKYITDMKTSASDIYVVLVNWFLSNLAKLSTTYKLTVKLFLNNIDRSIRIPDIPSCKKCLNELDVEFKNNNMVNSVANICAYSCLLFVTSVGKHNMSKYYLKDTWVKNFNGGVK